jgi:Protein of unknown function (DUF3311)
MASEPVVASDRSPGDDLPRERGPGALRRLAYCLLLGECLVILIPSIYGRLTPKLFGFPFFYWFQLLWILVAMAVTGVVYLLTTVRAGTRPRERAGTYQADEEEGKE